MEIYKTTEEINVIFKFLRREEKWKEFKNPVTFNRTTQPGQQVSREGCVRGKGAGSSGLEKLTSLAMMRMELASLQSRVSGKKDTIFQKREQSVRILVTKGSGHQKAKAESSLSGTVTFRLGGGHRRGSCKLRG